MKKKNRHINDFTHTEATASFVSDFHTVFSHSYFTGVVHKVELLAESSQSRVPLATPSHFPSDRKQGAVFLYKFGFTAGRRKSLLAKVSL